MEKHKQLIFKNLEEIRKNLEALSEISEGIKAVLGEEPQDS